jgi:hypothetical protein
MPAKANPTLIFPGGMPLSVDFLRRCQARGQPVIGASSLPADPARSLYADWAYLPMVTDTAFDAALAALIEAKGIIAVFSPNLVVWKYFSTHLARIAPQARLLNASPAEEAVAGFRQARTRAEQQRDEFELACTTTPQPKLSSVQHAAVFRHAGLIPGMCDDDKIQALCEIMRFVPQGDLVEIGSWWGKSAFVIAMLSRQFGLGSLLCVDPWQQCHLMQDDAHAMVDQVVAELDAEEALTIFQMNLAPFGDGRVNYLRLPSVEAAARYRQSPNIHSVAFGGTGYTGRIALLHIDGNHTLEAVQADVAAWADLVVSGGWIIFDDYVWPYGDGPKVTGDAFLFTQPERIATAFVRGSALFVQLG